MATERALLTGTDPDGRHWEVTSVSVSRWAGRDDISIGWSFTNKPNVNNQATGSSSGIARDIYRAALADDAIQADIRRQAAALNDRADADRIEAAKNAELAKQRRADLNVRIADCEKRGTRIYVRFGQLPACGRSYNHKDDRYEDGVSVYAAWRMPGGAIVLDLRGVDWVSHVMGNFADRTMHIAHGRHIGTGSDGEPLLTNVKLTRAGTNDYEMVG